MSKTQTRKSDARKRILETAEQLFYAEGIRTVGIDRIIAEAGVAKMTLYNHFPSKDVLILEALKYREEKFDAQFDKWMQKHLKKGMNPLLAFFGALKDWFKSSGFRGCMFINACAELADAEHEGSRFSAEHKERFHKLLEDAISETTSPQRAAEVNPTVALLVEGAIVSAVMKQSPKPAEIARDAAMAIISEK